MPTPIYIAIEQRHNELFQCLLPWSPDEWELNYASSHSGDTALTLPLTMAMQTQQPLSQQMQQTQWLRAILARIKETNATVPAIEKANRVRSKPVCDFC